MLFFKWWKGLIEEIVHSEELGAGQVLRKAAQSQILLSNFLILLSKFF